MRKTSTIGVLFCLLPAYPASATIYTDHATFNGAFPGLPVQDFESAGATQRDFGDFFVRSGSGLGTACGTTTSGFPSRVVFGYNSDDTLDIVFANPVQAVGFQVADYDFFDSHALNCYVFAYSTSGTLLQQAVPYATNGKAMTTFIGFGNLGPIGYVRVSDISGQPGMLAIDDVAYGVPAPATVGVLLAGVFAGRRRR